MAESIVAWYLPFRSSTTAVVYMLGRQLKGGATSRVEDRKLDPRSGWVIISQTSFDNEEWARNWLTGTMPIRNRLFSCAWCCILRWILRTNSYTHNTFFKTSMDSRSN